MHFQYLPYLWLLLASTILTVALGLYAWRHRSVLGATPFAVLMFLAALWSFANGLEMAGTDLATKLFWANVQYLCYTTIPVAWLALALQISGRGEWLTRRNLALLTIEPTITVLLAWTDPLFGLVRRNIHLDTAGPFPVIAKTFGPWFWVHAAYTYLMLAATLFLFIRTLWRAPPIYRRQRLTLLIGVLLPLAWNVLYNFGLSPIPRHDIAPAVLGLSGMIVAWGLFRFRLFDIMPLARTEVIRGMEHGVIVLDEQNRVVDVNRAVRNMLGQEKVDGVMGLPAKRAFVGWPGLAEQVAAPAPVQAEVSIASTDASPPHTFSLRISSLTDRHQRPLGRVLILNDVTERKEVAARLSRQQQALAVLEERERLARELHDSLGQVLGYVNVQSQAVQALLARDKPEQAQERLVQLADAARSAQIDVREYIASVRTNPEREADFSAVLVEMLQGFQRLSGIESELTFSGNMDALVFSPTVEVQLTRIVQEALSNVRKHAQADRVQVTVAELGDHAEITIADDGLGFDPIATADSESGHFGLKIMAERAASVGGQLQVESHPGEGTRIVIKAPIATAESTNSRENGGD